MIEIFCLHVLKCNIAFIKSQIICNQIYLNYDGTINLNLNNNIVLKLYFTIIPRAYFICLIIKNKPLFNIKLDVNVS